MSRLKPYETYCMRCDRAIPSATERYADEGPVCAECFDRDEEERARARRFTEMMTDMDEARP